MSQDRVFSIVGDSNIRRFNVQVNKRACKDLSDAQVLTVSKLLLLPDVLKEIRSESTVCIVSCITNFLCDAAPGPTSVSSRVEPVLESFRKTLLEACIQFPDRKYLICPPMYRRSPLWYRDGLSDVMKKFSSMMSDCPSSNLCLLPSFSSPDYDADGIHLTQNSGLEFIFHLFDSSKAVLDLAKQPLNTRQIIACETIRALEDRMMATEQDHKRLNLSFEAKMAVDAELADFQENVRNEVFFVISGLPRISQDLRGREWQARAVSDVKKLIQELLGKELPVVVVQNVTGRGTDVTSRYHVKMEFTAHSQEVRSKFGSFFIGGVDRRPSHLKGISISNRVTPGTQVRVAVLRALGQNYEDSNNGGKAKVISYESRPIIRITPPPEVTDRRVRTFTYMEAIRSLPIVFSSDQMSTILKKVDPKFRGKLRSTFVVLDDDALSKFSSGRNKRVREEGSSEDPNPKR
jgi:hypothetical protein